MRVALFARYSSKLQDELSLDAQLQEMTSFVAKQEGWRIVSHFLLPETRSADIENSDQFQAMIGAAKRKEFEILLVHKLDRFGRDREHSVLHKAMLRRQGIHVKSVVENFGDGLMDRAMEGMLEVMAEWYSGNLGQETRKGHRQLTRKGYWTGGKVPYGYTTERVLEGSQERRRLIVCIKDGPVMHDVFKKVAGNTPTSVVIDHIKAMTGQVWTMATLYTRLRNPIYYGLAQYGKTAAPQGRPRKRGEEITTGQVEPLIDKETWEAANMAIKSRGRAAGGHARAKESYLLAGLCTCKLCGAPIVGNRQGQVARYSCANRHKRNCTFCTVRAEDLEQTVTQELAKWLSRMDPDRLTAAYKESLEPIKREAEDREKRLRKRLTEVRTGKKNLLAALEKGIYFDDMQTRINALTSEESDLAQEIGLCGFEADQVVHVNSAMVQSYLDQVQTRITEADPEDVKILLQHLLEIEFDLKEKTGQLKVQLPCFAEDAEQFLLPGNPRLHSGRSARIRGFPPSRVSSDAPVPVQVVTACVPAR